MAQVQFLTLFSVDMVEEAGADVFLPEMAILREEIRCVRVCWDGSTVERPYEEHGGGWGTSRIF